MYNKNNRFSFVTPGKWALCHTPGPILDPVFAEYHSEGAVKMLRYDFCHVLSQGFVTQFITCKNKCLEFCHTGKMELCHNTGPTELCHVLSQVLSQDY